MTPSLKVLERKYLSFINCVRFQTVSDHYVKYTVLQYKQCKGSQPVSKLESCRAAPLPTVVLLYHPQVTPLMYQYQVTPLISIHSHTATLHSCIKP